MRTLAFFGMLFYIFSMNYQFLIQGFYLFYPLTPPLSILTPYVVISIGGEGRGNGDKQSRPLLVFFLYVIRKNFS